MVENMTILTVLKNIGAIMGCVFDFLKTRFVAFQSFKVFPWRCTMKHLRNKYVSLFLKKKDANFVGR